MFTAPSHSSFFRVAIVAVLCGAFGACAKAGVVSNQPIPPTTWSDASLAADARMGSDIPPLIITFPDAAPPPVYLDAAPVFVPQNIETMRIVPADSTITVQRGQSATVDFHAFATLKGGYPEIEITDRTVFYVPDNYLVGTFSGRWWTDVYHPFAGGCRRSASARWPGHGAGSSREQRRSSAHHGDHHLDGERSSTSFSP